MSLAYYGIPDFVDWDNPVNTNAPLNQGLVSWWKVVSGFQGWGSGKLHDMLGRSPGTLTNGPTWQGAMGRPGGFGSLRLDGTDDYLLAGPPVFSAVGTIAMWICPAVTISGATNTGPFVNGDPAAGGTPNTLIWRWDDGSPGGALRIYLFDGGFKAVDTTTTTWTAGVWYHVGCVWNGSTVSVFVNGILQASSAAGNLVEPSPAGAWRIGASSNGPTLNRFFNGKMDDIAYWTRPLSGTEVRVHYQASLAGHPTTLNWLPRRWYAAEQGGGGGGGNRRRRVLICGAA